MPDIVPKVVTEVEDLFSGIEREAVVVWNDFLGGIHYLSTEAAALAKWVENADPAIQSQVQTLIKLGETAAADIVAAGNPALANLISTGIDAAEQAAANLIQKATGNSPAGVSATAIVASGLTDLGTIVNSAATVGFTKAIAAITSAAAPLTTTGTIAATPPQSGS